MKSAFETYLLVFLASTFVLIGFFMIETTLKYNQARIYQEDIISLIERHNRYDSDIMTLIDKSKYKCNKCEYSAVKENNKYLVSVNFNVSLPLIKFSKKGQIKSFTQSLN